MREGRGGEEKGGLYYFPWAFSGNVVEAVRHARQIKREIGMAQAMSSAELYGYAKVLGVPIDLLQKTAKLGRLPVVNFAAGGLGV